MASKRSSVRQAAGKKGSIQTSIEAIASKVPEEKVNESAATIVNVPAEDAFPEEEDDEELALRSELFGIRVPAAKKLRSQIEGRTGAKGSHEQIPDDALFFLDSRGDSDEDETTTTTKSKKEDSPAWEDSDDEDVEVDISKTDRLRKLRKGEQETVIKGKDYAERLREQYGKIYNQQSESKTSRSKDALTWSRIPERGEKTDGDEVEEEEVFLKQTTTLLNHPLSKGATAQNKKKQLRQQLAMLNGRLVLTRLRDANSEEISRAVVQSVDWHHLRPDLMLTAGFDKTFRLFRVAQDQQSKSNQKVQSVHFSDLPIHTAKFSGDTSVVLTGRRPYYYTYELEHGTIRKVKGIFGRGEEMKSLETFTSSKVHDTIAFLGNDGYISLVSRKDYREVGFAKFPSSRYGRFVEFYGTNQLLGLSEDGEVCCWDFRNTSQPMWRRSDEGNIRATSLACNAYTGAFATGSASGVCNLYEMESGKKIKSIMNLTTKIDTCAFDPTGQVLAMSSSQKRDAVRLVHIPSGCKVVVNWPRTNTPLAHVSAISFSHQGNYISCGNDHGRVLLWRMEGL